jgi:hypothetical protein
MTGQTKSELVVIPSGGQLFCSPHDHRAQNSGCGYTAWSFYTARAKSTHYRSATWLSATPPNMLQTQEWLGEFPRHNRIQPTTANLGDRNRVTEVNP